MATPANVLRELLTAINTISNNQPPLPNTIAQQLIGQNSPNNQESSSLVDKLKQAIPQILESLDNQQQSSPDKTAPATTINHAFKPVAKKLTTLHIPEPILPQPQYRQAQPFALNTPLSPSFISHPGQQTQYPYANFSYIPNNTNNSAISRPIFPGFLMSASSQPETMTSQAIHNPLQNQPFDSFIPSGQINQLSTLVNSAMSISITPQKNALSTTQIGKFWINLEASHFQNNCLTLFLKHTNDVRSLSRHLHKKYNEQVISHLLQQNPSEKKIRATTEDISIKLYFKPELSISSKEEAIDSLKIAIKTKKAVVKVKTPQNMTKESANNPQKSRIRYPGLTLICTQELEDVEASSFNNNCLNLHLKDAGELRKYSRHLRSVYSEIAYLLMKKPPEHRSSVTKKYLVLNFKPECGLKTKEEAINTLKKALWVIIPEKEKDKFNSKNTTQSDEYTLMGTKVVLSNSSTTTTTTTSTQTSTAEMLVDPVVSLTKTPSSPLIANSLFRLSQTATTQNTASSEQVNAGGRKRKREEDESSSEETLEKKQKIEESDDLSETEEDNVQMDKIKTNDEELSDKLEEETTLTYRG